MFSQTSNKYQFKYLNTRLTGNGIECVYLPVAPSKNKILFKKENKFVRTIVPEYLQAWMDQFEIERANDPDYIHPHQEELNEWEEREFERCRDGVHFWNKGIVTFITGDYYKYLTQWQPLFGFPDYRESDKEVFYYIKFCEEDPECFGMIYNTLRREGKSTKMGFWIANRVTTQFKHLAGMQGQENNKIISFYNQMVIQPFYRLPYWSKPTYDESTLQKKGIIFQETPKRNKKRIQSQQKLVLESVLDFRTSEAGAYDQMKLNSYLMEEPGKTLSCNVGQRWNFVKPCLRLGKKIIGKAFLGTTVEFMDASDKGGKAYKKLCFESSFDRKGKDGRTTSGLYAAMMPADCAYEGLIDEWGYPMREEARKTILDERDAVKNNPRDHSALIRKFPLDWNEVFYISADKCEFNSTILQDRRSELQMNPPQLRNVDLRWENNVRFSKIIMYDNPDRGWLSLGWIPKELHELEWLNNVGIKHDGQKKKYFPKNDTIFQCGTDPIDHGVRIEATSGIGDENLSTRRSRPVLWLKRKYNSSIDGVINQEILEERARMKYSYKTNIYFGKMDQRPNDPNIYFERALMICWLFGTSIHCESQKPGLMNWFNNSDCEDFVQNKYVPNPDNFRRSDANADGTPASPMMIQEYTAAIATDVEYFGHTYLFIEMCDDDLIFDPNKTKEHDYTVAQGWTELAGKNRSRIVESPTRAITEYFRRFDRNGRVIK